MGTRTSALKSTRQKSESDAPKNRLTGTRLLLGNEAVAWAAFHSGIRAAYSYPGTPSTEILETLQSIARKSGESFIARWCANEKTAYERALGVSFAGRRALVSMKHVGLNVAADPFVNSALLKLRGGLVLVVADDPGMESSQNEQDSRLYADIARIICLEPSNPDEAYRMTRKAFDLSEKFQIPVMIRTVGNVSHSRSAVQFRKGRPVVRRPTNGDRTGWVLLPTNARARWTHLLAAQESLQAVSEKSPFNREKKGRNRTEFGVITAGISRNYFEEAIQGEGLQPPRHLHIGFYPLPLDRLQKFALGCQKVLVLEEGYPFIERFVRGIRDEPAFVCGKDTGHVPASGQMTPEVVFSALGSKRFVPAIGTEENFPPRPPRLCDGCPHRDTFNALARAIEGLDGFRVMSDIGCYTLGALKPFELGDSCVCMGASIGMAHGLVEAEGRPVIALIGDSTFLHSGMPSLLEAVAEGSNLTVILLDNRTVAMTGGQSTLVPSESLEQLLLGMGVARDHLVTFKPHPRAVEAAAALIRVEIGYPGLSVIIARRECVRTAARKRRSP